MRDGASDRDHRTGRTRGAILDAFTLLAFKRRYDAIRIADLVDAAGIGRATFYEHFSNKDAVLMAAMEPILSALANAASGRGATAHVRAMLDHVWQQRGVARVILQSAAGAKLQRKLASMIAVRVRATLPGDAAVAVRAAAASAAQMAMVKLWIAGEASCSADAMAQQMIACSSFMYMPQAANRVPEPPGR